MMNRPLMRHAFVLCAGIFFTWLSSARAEKKPESFAPGQVIIKFRPSARHAEAQAIRANLHATVKKHFKSIDAELWEVSGISVEEAVSRYRNDPGVAFVEPNYALHADDVVPDDPRFGELWGLHNTGQSGGTADADIDAPEAWSIGTGGSVLVGVIDTGVDWHHADLAANIYTNPGEIPDNDLDDDHNGFVDDIHGWDFVNGDNNPYDDHGHGTHVSGTIAAVGNNGTGVVGVCWSARIMPLKFLDAEGYGWTSDAVLAVEYATMMGVRLTSNSWGGGGNSAALRSAIEAAGNHGILFVAAAGNDGSNTDGWAHYPSSYNLDNIISVASTDRRDNRSDFSNYGLVSVDLGAPGSDILSTFPNNRYGTISGTSMATPHVSGAAALVLSAAPEMTGLEVKSAILSTVDPLPSLAGKVVSGGRLNVHTLLSSLDDIPPARVADLAVQSRGSSTMRLMWTATGDDGAVGTATRYDIRYSTARITPQNFLSAERAAGAPHPKPAGSSESFEVTGLAFNTKYYFAIVVEDEQGNRSPVSDFTKATTMGVPWLNYTPGTFAASLLTGGRETQTLTLRNGAAGTLDFSTAASPSWIRVNPPSGRVHAGKALQVNVIFDATRLSGGAYDSTITLSTNDPTQRTVLLPVALQVTDAADISVEPASIDFGVHYTSTCATDTVVVRNIGTVALSVTDVALSDPQLTTDVGPFSLDPGQSRDVPIEYCPVAVAMLKATLSLQSNDPDHPAYAIAIKGQGVAPPVITVTPPAVSDDLLTGGKASHVLTISNLGGSALTFEIDPEGVNAPEGASSRAAVSSPRRAATPDAGTNSQDRTPRVRVAAHAGRAVAGRDGVQKEILVIQDYLAWNVDMGQFITQEFAIVPTVINSSQIETTDFAPFDVVITTGDQDYFYYGAISANVGKFEQFVGNGGVVQYQLATQGEDVSIVGGAVVQFGEFDMFNNVVAPDHPIVAGLPLVLAGNWANHCTVANLPPGTVVITETSDYGSPTTVEYEHGMGTVIATGMTWEYLHYYGYEAGEMMRNAVAYSMEVAGVPWLRIAPMSGTVPAGQSIDIAVGLDATDLYGGNYLADVHIANNSLIHPDLVVPVAMHVTGVPDIALSDSLLDYGAQFIGAAIKKALVVSNPGTDVLTVGVAASQPVYSVDLPAFTVAPKASQNIVVTFAPLAVGAIPAVLNLTTNDHDEGLVSVDLRGTGVAPPVIAVEPAALAEDLLTGETSTHALTISNSGESELSFSIGFENVGGPEPPGTTAAQPERGNARASSAPRIEKGHVDAHSYPPMAALNGGPDAFGYRWRDSNTPGGPSFEWIDVSGGTSLYLWDDDYQENIPLGFTFTYYDGSFSAVGVGSNGWLSFNGINEWFPYEVPREDYYPGAIAPFARDLYPEFGGYIRYQTFGTAPRRQFVVEYNNIADYGDGIRSTFEVIFTEGTNSIRFQYLTVRHVPRGFGIESLDQSTGIGNAGAGDLFLSPALVRNNYVIEFTVAPRWLRTGLVAGTVAPHGSVEVPVTYNAAGMFGGDYAANLLVGNNDPIHPEVVVPIALHVTGAPDIAVGESLLDYGWHYLGTTASRTLVVSNVGTDLLTVSSMVSSHADFAPDTTSFTLAPGMSRNVVVTFAPTSPGAVSAMLSIHSDDPDEGVVTVELRGEGVSPPVIAVAPASLYSELLTNQTTTRAVTIDNIAGGSELVWALSLNPGAGWLHASPTSGTLPAGSSAAVTVSFDAAAMYGGTYDDGLIVTSNDPVAPRIVVPVRLHVTGVPDITVTPASLSYGPVFIGVVAEQTLSITNNGTDSLVVDGIASDQAEFTPASTAFALSPFGTKYVVVSFAPTTPGTIDGQLTISSNDPDEGAVVIALAGTGVEPPVMAVSPRAVADTLMIGETSTHTVTVSNTGESNLEISVVLVDVSQPGAMGATSGGAPVAAKKPGPATLAALPEIAKGEDDTRSYPPMTRGSGGPDAFGYQWRDSNEPNGPVFNWIDVSGGTNLSMLDDDFIPGIPLGFTFRYYGELYTTIGVGANGWLSFNGSNTWFPSNVPAMDLEAGAIAPFARDLFPPGAAYIRYKTFGVAPHRQFVVEYNHIPDYGPGILQKTFEVIFTESANSIRFQYLEVPNPPVALGIESPDQTMGMGNAGTGDLFISPWLVSNNYAIEFSGVPEWVMVSPSFATIPPGESLDLATTLDAALLEGGDHAAIISIVSNDPIHPAIDVNVSLHVNAPGMALAVAAIDVPTRFDLKPNYPNPFNPATIIAYDLPRAVDVRLLVFDVGGRQVVELVRSLQPAGRHEIAWDGRNASRERVASGVYFYRLIAGDFVQTKKMVLLK